MTMRRFGVLLRGLPADSRTWCEERGYEAPTWDQLMLTGILDALRWANYQRAAISGNKNARPPEPVRAPWTPKDPRRLDLDPNEVGRRLLDLQARTGRG